MVQNEELLWPPQCALFFCIHTRTTRPIQSPMRLGICISSPGLVCYNAPHLRVRCDLGGCETAKRFPRRKGYGGPADIPFTSHVNAASPVHTDPGSCRRHGPLEYYRSAQTSICGQEGNSLS